MICLISKDSCEALICCQQMDLMMLKASMCSGRNTLWQLKNPVERRYERSGHTSDDKGWVFASFSAPQVDKVHCTLHNLATTVCNDSGDEDNLCRINIVTWVRHGHVQNRNLWRKEGIRGSILIRIILLKKKRGSPQYRHTSITAKIALYQFSGLSPIEE